MLAELAPVALAGLAIAWVVLIALYRGEFRRDAFSPETVRAAQRALAVRPLRPVLTKSLVATALLLVAFVAGIPITLRTLLVGVTWCAFGP